MPKQILRFPKQFPYALLLFILGICGVALPYITNGNLPGDSGDSYFNAYILEHFYLALTGKVESFVTASFFYPLKYTVLFSDNHWGTGFIYSYFRSEGFTTEQSFAGWFLVGFILNYWTSFYVYRKLELSQLASSIAAFLFTFALPVLAQDGHAQLIYRPYVAFAVLAAYRYTHSKNLYHAAFAFLMLSLQFLVSVYNGLFLLYFLIALVAVELIASPKDKIKNLLPKEFCLTKSIPILIVAIAVLLLFAIPYLETKNLYNFGRSWWEIKSGIPQIQSYFLADNSSLWFKDLTIFKQLEQTTARLENQMFIGIGGALALLILYLRKGLLGESDVAFKFGYSTILVVAFTMMIGCFTLYPLLTLLVPGSTSIRAVAREILVLLFPIGYLVGLAIDRIRNFNFTTLSASTITFIICALIVIDPIFASKSITTTKIWQDRLKNLEAKITKPLDQSSILAVSSLSCADEIDAMILAQKLNVKTINGYFGNYPGRKGGWRMLTTMDDVEYRIRGNEETDTIDRNKIVYIGFENHAK